MCRWPTASTCSARREGADKTTVRRSGWDADEAARTRQARPELAHVEVAVLVGLRQAQDGDIEATTVVEVELVGLVDDGLQVHGRAKFSPPARIPPTRRARQ